METTPFCERQTNLWVASLIIVAALVLGYAFWLTHERGEFNGFNSGGTVTGLQGGRSAVGSPVGAVLVGGFNATGSSPAYSSGQANQPYVDAVSGATANGGFKLIGGAQASHLQSAFHTAADVIRPSVVKISVDARVRATPPSGASLPGEFHFANPFDGVADLVIDQRPFESVGSGLIVDEAGYVVTNHHVVAGAQSVVVSRFHRSEEHLPATVVAVDASRDLALLHITQEGDYQPAVLADSDRVEVGDWVLAVGNPFGLEHTVSAGIVGARGATLNVAGLEYQGLLQTDAPINKGSSGGPLVNLSGQVVGINTAIYAPTGVFSGTGFAIPSNSIRAFVTSIAADTGTAMVARQPTATTSGTVLGVGVSDVTPDLTRKLACPHAGGAFVNTVVTNSVADRAQIRRGDVITALAGQPVLDCDGLERASLALMPGRPLAFTVWRSGKTKVLDFVP